MINNPYVEGNTTKLKIVLACDKGKAWELIATPVGLAAWFPSRCEGNIIKGEEIVFHWPTDPPEKFIVLDIHESQWWEMTWYDNSKIRYVLEWDNPVIFKLEVKIS